MFKRYTCVRQADQADCGPAALATIALHHGLRVSRERMRDVVGTDRRGTNLLGLLVGATKLGLSARAVKGDWAGLSTIALPAIAHVRTAEGLGHYVVIHRVLGDAVLVADPARGIERRDRSAFVAQWTGYVLLASPTPQLRRDAGISPGRRLVSLILGQRRLLLEAFACAVLMTFLGLGSSLFVQHLCDSILVRGELALLDALGLGMLLVIAFRAAFSALRQYLLAFAGRRAGYELLSGFVGHALHLPMRFYELRQTGDVLARVQDTVRVRDAITGVALSVLVDGAMVIVAMVALWLQDARLAAVATAFVPLMVAGTLAHHPAARRRTRIAMEEGARVHSQLVEDVGGVETIKAFGLEPARREQGEARFANLLGKAFSQQMLGISATTIAMGLMGAAGVIVLWYGGHRVVDGALSIGQLMFFYTLLGYVLQPLERLAGASLQLEDATIALDRLHQVMDLDPEPGHGKGVPCHGVFRGVELEGVSFKYGTRAPVLDGVDLEFPAGKRVALLGESGSGKTTVLKLLQRFYDPTDGCIRVDGVDVRDLDVASLRARIGVVSQEPFLFAGTLRENLLAAKPDASAAELGDAIRIAGLGEVIGSLPERLETVVGERGIGLSGGQRQRIAIARAALRRPDLLLLDEATSHLDSATERSVQTALDSVLAGKTVVIVAHRLATVRNADLIYVLHRGKVVEQGTHVTLLAKGGRYAELWRTQIGEPPEGKPDEEPVGRTFIGLAPIGPRHEPTTLRMVDQGGRK